MPTISPNQNREQFTDRPHIPQEYSDDQRILPGERSEEMPDERQGTEPNAEPQHVKRIDRDTMEKLRPADPDPDDPTTP